MLLVNKKNNTIFFFFMLVLVSTAGTSKCVTHSGPSSPGAPLGMEACFKENCGSSKS